MSNGSALNQRATPPERGVDWLWIAVIGFAATQSVELPNAWRTSPLDRVGPICFAAWAAPILAAVRSRTRPFPRGGGLLWGAIALLLLGTLAEMNALRYFGLAFGLAHAARRSAVDWIWLGSAVSWMPASSWLLASAGREAAWTLKLVAAAVGVAAWSGWRERSA